MNALQLFASTMVLATAAIAQNPQPAPGTALIYPVHRSGYDMFTILCVTNTSVAPATPTSFGGSVNAHFEYVNVTPNPENAFMPLGCTVFDRIEFLTPADTLCVLTSCHNAAAPGGQEGYVVVTAEDPNAFKKTSPLARLVGSEMVVNGFGTIYSINAIAAVGYGRGPDGSVNFATADALVIDSFVALAGSQLTLINASGSFQDKNELYFSVFNDNERALSATLRFSCWFDQPLTEVSPLFAESFLASIPNDPAELDINCDGLGDLETGWATIQSRGVFNPGGQLVSPDGAVLGAITAGGASSIDGGRPLWAQSPAVQAASLLGH